MTSWHSYGKILALGHRYIQHLLLDPVLVEEKIDGSQFSFGVFEYDGEGEYPGLQDPYTGRRRIIRVRSKGAEMHVDAPERMFAKGVEWVKENAHRLHEGWTYRAEFLAKPKHNALNYDRVPKDNIIIFDINPGQEEYLSYDAKHEEAARLGLEVVPRLHEGKIETIAEFRQFLDVESILGGQKVEGVVVKNYVRFNEHDGHAMMGKFVSEHFKEVHAKEWKASNPTKNDVIQKLIDTYRSPARYQKALIHLRERGLIKGDLTDIGTLMKETWPDIVVEEKDAIMEKLWGWAEDQIRRGVSAGIPEWYKEELLKSQFDAVDNEIVGEHAGVPITRREEKMISADGV
jgi:hypothetical protein